MAKLVMPRDGTPHVIRFRGSNGSFIQQNRPELVQAIGMVALSWTDVEDQMDSMFSGILGNAGSSGDGGWGVNPNWVISSIMSDLTSNNLRIKAINSVMTIALKEHELAGQWRDLQKRLLELATIRNRIVHSAWCWSEEMPAGILEPRTPDTLLYWDQQDFDTTIGATVTLLGDLRGFMRSVFGEMAENRIPLLQMARTRTIEEILVSRQRKLDEAP